MNQPQLGKDWIVLLLVLDVKRQQRLRIREKKVKETTGSRWRLVGRHTAVDNCATSGGISGGCDRPKTLPQAATSATTGDLPGATSVVFSSWQGEGGHQGGQAVSAQDSRVGRFGQGIVVVMKTSTSSLAVLALALVQVS